MTTSLPPLYLAVDTADLNLACHWARTLTPYLGGLKLGMEFFYAHGILGYRTLAQMGLPIFLDLKLHDIPQTVAQGISSLLSLDHPPRFITVHVAGGRAMLEAAVEAASGRCDLLGVTVLTSLDQNDLSDMGLEGTSVSDQALRYAHLALASGLKGVVASAHEVSRIKAECGQHFLTMVPGIRPASLLASTGGHDQKRTASAAQALSWGADLLVIGRCVTQSEFPEQEMKALREEIRGGTRAR